MVKILPFKFLIGYSNVLIYPTCLYSLLKRVTISHSRTIRVTVLLKYFLWLICCFLMCSHLLYVLLEYFVATNNLYL